LLDYFRDRRVWVVDADRLPAQPKPFQPMLSAVAPPANKNDSRVCFINPFQVGGRGPQGLKPAFLLALNGTAEAVPYPKPIYETPSSH
jgi:hypothetical protein